jgi:uncharacterized protein DUF6599
MQQRKIFKSFAAIALLIASPLAIIAQQPEPSASDQVIAVRTARPLSELLPDKLAGAKATSEIKQYSADNIAELVADKAPVYQEYSVQRAASRQYGRARVDLFETQTALSAFGLLTYTAGASADKAMAEEIGAGGALVDGALVFRKDNYFARVTNADFKLARALAEAITSKDPAIRPRLLDDLPKQSLIAKTERYFLGPESLNTYVERGRDMFGFAGDAEAVMAEYSAPTTENNSTENHSRAAAHRAAPAPRMKIVIIEYKTPQFAFDAIERATGYVNSLPEAEQSRIIVKREGNYLVEAVSFQDRQSAQALVDSVKYPYGVKWLHDPRLPPRDPFRMQKAAAMLVSTFGLLGLLLSTVCVIGAAFGATIFLKRRKQQAQAFSDAGGMLRLELDPFESTMLGLPPKREEG